jgi:hypothetical protein
METNALSFAAANATSQTQVLKVEETAAKNQLPCLCLNTPEQSPDASVRVACFALNTHVHCTPLLASLNQSEVH